MELTPEEANMLLNGLDALKAKLGENHPDKESMDLINSLYERLEGMV